MEYRPPNHEQKIYVAGYEILIRPSTTFSGFMRDCLSSEVKAVGQNIKRCEPMQNLYTFGASVNACVAGVALPEDLECPVLFHITPTHFEEKSEMIDGATWGIVGGSVNSFGMKHPAVLTNNYIRKPNSPFSIALKNLGNKQLQIYYM